MRAVSSPRGVRMQVGTNDGTTPSRTVVVTHTGPVFRVERLTTRDAQGRTMERDVVRHPGAVTVIAIGRDHEGRERVTLIRNRRIAVDRQLIEFCAGKLERGEDPAIAAGRELEEECGFRAGRLERLGQFFTSPGFADETMHVFLACDLVPVPQRLEPGEEIEVLDAAPEEVDAMVRDGRIEDGKTIASWMLWRLAQGARG